MNVFLEGIHIKNVQVATRLDLGIEKINNKGRSTHGFVYFVKGENTYYYDGITFTARPNSLLYLPKDRAYRITRHTEATTYMINFETIEDFSHDPLCINFDKNSFADIFISSINTFHLQRPGSEAELLSNVYRIASTIIQMQRLESMPRVYHQRFRNAIDYIDSHYLEADLRVESLAEMAQMSSRYFTKLFVLSYGVAPKEYIIKRKIDKASNLLLTTNIQISEISDICGFSDIFYFSKLFKKYTNYSPSAYRNNMTTM